LGSPIDLDPGDYRERKPKGWRWRLPWSHPEDSKLPLVLMIGCIGFLVYFFVNMPADVRGIAAGVAVAAFFAGGLFMWAFSD